MKRRGHGEGSYYQVSDGRWRAALTITSPDGRSARKYFGPYRTKREAMIHLARYREATTAGRAATMADGRATLGAFLDRWLADVTAADVRMGTARSYRVHVDRLKAACGGYRLDSISAGQLAAVQTALHNRYAPSTVKVTIGTLRRALDAAESYGAIARSPARSVRPLRRPAGRRRALTIHEATPLLAGAGADRLAALWCTLLATGIRIGEALALEWRDVHTAGGASTLTVRRSLAYYGRAGFAAELPKTRRGQRVIPLLPQAASALEHWRSLQAGERASPLWEGSPLGDLIFARANGRPYHEAGIRAYWIAVRKHLALPVVTVHDLRRTTATLMIRAGIDPAIVAELLGHASARLTLDVYTASGRPSHEAAIGAYGRSFAALIAAYEPAAEAPAYD